MREDTNKCKDIPSSCIGGLNAKISVQPKAINSMQCLVKSFHKTHNPILRFIWNFKEPCIAKTNLKKNQVEGLTFPHFKMKDTETSEIEHRHQNFCIFCKMMFHHGIKTTQWRKDSLFNKRCWKKLDLHMQKKKCTWSIILYHTQKLLQNGS